MANREERAIIKRDKRPTIGVTGPDSGGCLAWFATYIAIYRAGGKARRIRPGCPCDVAEIDGLVIGGGADVDPKLYSQEPVMPQIRRQWRKEMHRRWEQKQHQDLIGYTREKGLDLSLSKRIRAVRRLMFYRIGEVVDVIFLIALWLLRRMLSTPWHSSADAQAGRDDLEVPLVRAAVKRGLPVLGICRGMQLINVCFGGSLHQEVSIFYEESPQLTTLLPRKRIEIAGGTHLHQILHRPRLRVNSLHYQSVDLLGRGLCVAAREPNGVVQAIEHSASPFLIGVQWHPEYLPFDSREQRLFSELVKHARNNRPGARENSDRASETLDSVSEAISTINASRRYCTPGTSF